MKFLISTKVNAKAKPIKQAIVDYTIALNMARKALLAIQSMEESSADLQAMNIMDEVASGTPKGFENPKTGYVLVIQRYADQ